MVQVFDGEKGYMINPMMGSTDPVEMTGRTDRNRFRTIMFSRIN